MEPFRWGPSDGARRVEGPKCCAFSSFSRSPFSLFLCLSGSSRGILVVFEVPGPEMRTFRVLGLSCETLAAPKPSGFHRTARELKRAHFRVAAFENTTKIQREDTQRDTKRTKSKREGKKERNFGRSGEGGSGGGWSGAGLSRDIRTNNNHNNHNHNNTNNARSGVEVKPRTSVAPKGGGDEGAPKGGVPNCGPQRVGPTLAGVWGSGLIVGLWVFGVWAFWVQKIWPKH